MIRAATDLPSWSRNWRICVLILGVFGIVRGTLIGQDVDWPLAPMGQYAFSVPDDGQVHSPGLEGQTVAGEWVRIPLTADGVGVRRAEIESQLPDFQNNPAKLQALAAQAARRHPKWPRYRALRLIDDLTQLREGRVSGTSREVLATWVVQNPDNPAERPE